MSKHFSRLAAAVSAAALLVSSVPYCPISIADAADTEYKVRDPFFNFSSEYNYYESEHFQFIWGNTGADSSRVTQTFLEGNAKNMEACWDVYMNELSMAPPSESVELYLRDGNQYKTNLYISGTGLNGMAEDWAYMAWDNGGFAYMFCCVDAMQVSPPSWVLPHEFGHVMTAHQRGWNSNKYSYAWWEAIGNWYREQYLYSDYSTDDTGHGTDFFETYMKNLCFTFPCGRDYYAAWPFLQYLTENPENLEGYGADFVKTMLQQGQVDEFPFDQVERLAPADFKDTLGYFAAHMAGLDFNNGDAYRARLNELLAQGDWNWQQIYTMLEPVAGSDNTYTVPTERAPQFAGLNIIPLEVSGGTISVSLNGLTDVQGSDWRACIVQQTSDGSCTYSRLFKSGEEASAAYNGGTAYLAVIATPDLDTVTKYGLPGIYDDRSTFSESNVPFSSKTRYPYAVQFSDNVSIKKRTVSTESQNWWEQATYTPHSNGGGLVASTAKVDASVYVAPNAVVKGSATVTGNAKILDYAVVEGSAKVSDNAVISGYGMVAENAVVSGNARVDDCGLVMGRANVSGNAKVIESACVYGNTTMTDNSIAKGVAFIMANSSLSGQGVGDGDLYTDNNISFTKGTSYGWTSAQSYANSRPYTDNLLYAYDFDTDSSLSFDDRYNSTYGVNHGAVWEAGRTSAKGVLTFDGASYADIDRGVLYNDDFEIQLSVLSRNTGDNYQTLLYFGNVKAYFQAVVQDGKLRIITSDGQNPVSYESGKVINAGEWAKIRIISKNGQLSVLVNDQTVISDSIEVSMTDILENLSVHDSFASLRTSADMNAAYRIGADSLGQYGFTGSVDFVRIYSGETTAPTEVYTETEDVQAPVTTTTVTAATTTQTTTTTTAEVPATTTTNPYSLKCDKTDIKVGESVLVYVVNWDKPVRTWKESISGDSVSISFGNVIDFYVNGVKAGESEVTISIPGYSSLSLTFNVTDESTTQDGILWGDANVDGKVTVADAVAILQSIGNKDKYSLSNAGARNADVYDNGDGITPKDALTIQQISAGIYKQSDLPISYAVK